MHSAGVERQVVDYKANVKHPSRDGYSGRVLSSFSSRINSEEPLRVSESRQTQCKH